VSFLYSSWHSDEQPPPRKISDNNRAGGDDGLLAEANALPHDRAGADVAAGAYTHVTTKHSSRRYVNPGFQLHIVLYYRGRIDDTTLADYSAWLDPAPGH
jgi:hypothetical protein